MSEVRPNHQLFGKCACGYQFLSGDPVYFADLLPICRACADSRKVTREIAKEKARSVMDMMQDAANKNAEMFRTMREPAPSVADLVSDFNKTHDQIVKFASGVISTKIPRFELIPHAAMVAHARRLERGIRVMGDKSWNALTSRDSEVTTDTKFVIDRLAHCINHCYQAIARITGLCEPLDEEEKADGGDAGAILFAGGLLAEHLRVVESAAAQPVFHDPSIVHRCIASIHNQPGMPRIQQCTQERDHNAGDGTCHTYEPVDKLQSFVSLRAEEPFTK